MNYLAIAIATVAAMITGAIWYGPLFGKAWARIVGEPKTNAAIVYPAVLVTNFITSFVVAYVTGVSAAAEDNGFLVPALFSGFFLWLGFSFARQLVIALFEAKPKKLFLINTGHDLAITMVIATIIGLMGR